MNKLNLIINKEKKIVKKVLRASEILYQNNLIIIGTDRTFLIILENIQITRLEKYRTKDKIETKINY